MNRRTCFLTALITTFIFSQAMARSKYEGMLTAARAILKGKADTESLKRLLDDVPLAGEVKNSARKYGAQSPVTVAHVTEAVSRKDIDPRLDVYQISRRANLDLATHASINSKTGNLITHEFQLPEQENIPHQISISPSVLTDESRNGKRLFTVTRQYEGAAHSDSIAFRVINGNEYATVVETDLAKKDAHIYASLLGKKRSGAIDAREVTIYSEVTVDGQVRSVSGAYRLPEDAKGEIVSMRFNRIGDRLTLSTSEGVEYEVALKTVHETVADDARLSVEQVGVVRLADGAQSFLTKAKTLSGKVAASESTSTRGLSVDQRSFGISPVRAAK